jgi:23S rRNA (adenine2503-C2)-methyltransferase
VTAPLKVLTSAEDRSVNFVEAQLVGFLESRFVRKTDDYFICYLSSQTGCNRGCTFCHLTATGQTSFEDSKHNDFIAQAVQVLRHYRQTLLAGRVVGNPPVKPAKWMHYNFMARGEPLANRVLLSMGDELLVKLAELARDEDLPAKFNVSTIMPATFKGSLVDVFPTMTPTIYYSLYSVRPEFRAKWMPGAMPVPEALDRLKDYQNFSKKIVKVHYAFIRGENDSYADVEAVADALDAAGLLCEFNVVRYNPASAAQGTEADPEHIASLVAYLRTRLAGKVQVIPRVGFDVKASCGMFV